jgi:cytochrome c peroxidase
MNIRWVSAVALVSGLVSNASGQEAPGATVMSPDHTGWIGTHSTNGRLDTTGPFFQSLGTNGRSCATCHVAEQAFGISAEGVRQRFDSTRGRDPIFASVDGANCPNAAREDRDAHSLLLKSGLIRIFLPLPSNAQFTITAVHDPYGCALTTDPASGQTVVSVYRRPLPTTNLNFLSTVMFDGRETIDPLTSSQTFLENLTTDLTHQAVDAVSIHAQGIAPPTTKQLAQIVAFELGLFTAQVRDDAAGHLGRDGALGGPRNLAAEVYYPGINDSLGHDPSGAPFDSVSMTLYSAWANLPPGDSVTPAAGLRNEARGDIAAGETVFNTAPITITNVRGLNDNVALGSPASIAGHCTTCHDTPNVGDHSLPLPLDIGTGHSPLSSLETDPQIAAGLNELSMPDLPVFLISGCPDPFGSGIAPSFYTSDPGKALVTGQCGDLSRVKGPVLRGLAARAPYFHNGAAQTLDELVNFYNERFKMNLSAKQKRDLIAFLNAL